jgi:signal transduction histidine kinase
VAGAERRARRLPALWLGNLLVFGLLIALAVGWFVVQTRQVQRGFVEDTAAHARLLADSVALHARGALLAQEITDEALTAFLANSARFADYLDGIEPFHADELSAFAVEAGLSVIRIVSADGAVQGPPDRQADGTTDCARLHRLLRRADRHTVLYGIPRTGAAGCVLVGMDSRRIDRLRAAVGLPRALDAVAALPGVLGVRLDGETDPALARDGATAPPRVSIRRLADGTPVARARIGVAGAELVLDLDAGALLRQRGRLWRELAVLALALTLAGGLGTWLLFRHQQAHDSQLRDFERRLSQRREEAGLGRAAAAVAHEIRNPLNAVAMGLQRLRLEAAGLDAGQRRLLDLLLEAVRRTDGTVTGLLDYARPCTPRREPVRLERLVQDRLALYAPRLDAAGVAVRAALAPMGEVAADPALLSRIVDNLLRNAVEAMPGGGALDIGLTRDRDGQRLALTNDGLAADIEPLERILEPWFTTKTNGTGLGLALSRRIAEAHGGRLGVDSPAPGRLRVRLWLPD